MINREAIAALRARTQLGVARCHKALIQSQGNIEKAVELLRKEGASIASKRSGRLMSAGRVFIQVNEDKTQGVLLGLKSETDFVAKSNDLQAVGTALANQGLAQGIHTKEALLSCTYSSNATCEEEITQLAGRVGENIALSVYHHIEGPHVAHYLHTGGRIGAIVVLNTPAAPPHDIDKVGKNVAMQVVISDPIAISAAHIDPATLKREEEAILAHRAKEQRKAEAIERRIVAGQLNKFIQENILLTQPFIHDEKIAIGQYLHQIAPNLAVLAFKRVEMEA